MSTLSLAVMIYSILTEPAVDHIALDLLEPISLMTFRADRRTQDAPVFETRIGVNLVTVQTTDRLIAIDHDIAHISPDMPIAGIQSCITRSGEVHFKILK
jgi:hypothetical protein